LEEQLAKVGFRELKGKLRQEKEHGLMKSPAASLAGKIARGRGRKILGRKEIS